MQTPLFIFAVIAGGLVLGLIARWILPGEQRLSLAETTLIGMVGAGIGATGVNLIFGAQELDRLSPATFVGGILGSVLVLGVGSWLAGRFGWRQGAERTITDLVADGESAIVEFKSTSRRNLHTGQRDDKIELVIAKTVAGFLNADGGVLVIGVDDDGNALGLDGDLSLMKAPDHDRYELWLTDFLDTTLGSPALAFISVSFDAYDGDYVVVVRVLPSDSPVFVNEPKGNRTADFYVRMGNSTRRLLTDEFADYARSRWK
ncbi:MAG: RNA-binding domain-containing protein [Actinomycetota bacterium]